MALPEGTDPEVAGRAAALEARFGSESPQKILAAALDRYGPDEIAAVTSFGAESAVWLHMLAGIDPNVPILFIDTGKHFAATHRYRETLTEAFALTDVRLIRPDAAALSAEDGNGMLFSADPDHCCRLRKTEPLKRALLPFPAWINGRKRHQSATRAHIPAFEADGTRLKINPLANWGREEIAAYAARFDLPRNPLVKEGYASIGCMPCTSQVRPGEDERAGRWRGRDKTECGIHLGL
ncbi:phosphoadenylyl-sulfate reductase [Afifella sp. IM 167]|uniref:phosphoadenylyl-sulfate reductase n=1 Tax=Afifella sp. IM 167 TaxID=2033586 RepID=UPI001CCC5FA0|nr:phosphoadenylyl-sulfate reductase [Afifella sp. IM 167]MBZ8134993.1 phosphoadenylyl-sulfate reductase [Afifella sp. IM 167]